MSLPDVAKPRNKRLSFYKYVYDNLSDTYPVVCQGAVSLFGDGWLEDSVLRELAAWIELDVESFGGTNDARLLVRFTVIVRPSREDVDFMQKRADAMIESVQSLMNLTEGNVIPVYDFSDETDPTRIGEANNLGYIPKHIATKDRFDRSDPTHVRYTIHYSLWLWQEGVRP